MTHNPDDLTPPHWGRDEDAIEAQKDGRPLPCPDGKHDLRYSGRGYGGGLVILECRNCDHEEEKDVS